MKRILVVEDNQPNMYLIQFILTHAGYEVIQAPTGEAGVELALQEKPDLVIMDIQLPGIDGLEATQRIRSSPINGGLPIIALTSYAMAGDREIALEAGFSGYIEKPIDPDTFLAQIASFL